MLHIILVILKIIGIALAAILTLLFLVLLFILFVPICYRVRLKREGEELYAQGKVSYLMHLVTMTVEYVQNKPVYRFKVLGITLFPSRRKKRTKKRRAVKRKRKSKGIKDSQAEKSGSLLVDKEVEQENLTVQNTKYLPEDQSISTHSPMEDTISKEEHAADGKETFFGRIGNSLKRLWHMLNRAVSFIRRIPSILAGIKAAVKNLWVRLTKYWKIIRSEEAIALFGTSKKEMFYLLKHFKPRKAQGYLRIGTGDPASTGQIIGFACALMPFVYSGKIQVIPDFETSVLEGSIQFNGHIRVCHLIKTGWKIYRDKNLKKFLKRMKE